MSPGEYANLALSSVLSACTRDGIAVLVVCIGNDGGTHLATNARDRIDVSRILVNALEANASPDYQSDRDPPAKA